MRLNVKVEIDEQGYVVTEREQLRSFFLAPEKVTVEESVLDDDDDEVKCIVRNIIPVALRTNNDDIETSLMAALESLKGKQRRQDLYSWSGSSITDRDKGFYDNLSQYFTKWLKKPELKAQIYQSLRIKGNAPSPYHVLLESISKSADLDITGLLIEVADSPSEGSLSLGAAVMVCKKDYSESWKLGSNNCDELIKQERSSKEAKFIDCYMDELLGLHFVTKIPIVISENLYNNVCVDGLIEQIQSDDNTNYDTSNKPKTLITAPFFENKGDSEVWQAQLEQDRARSAKPVPKIDQIKDATTFLKMRLSEKRAYLRASGVVSLPRPREGPKKVDAVMIPLLDEEVAYEVLRRLGETKGDFDMAAKMNDFQSRKPILARQVKEAQLNGDIIKAKEICDELNSLSTLRFDPSNPDDEVTNEGFDIEEWYWQERKRIYGIL